MQTAYVHWNIDPEIVNFLGLSVRYYGILFIGGLMLSLYILGKMYENRGISPKLLDTLAIYGIVGIGLGARLVHCFFYDTAYYLEHPLEILLPIQYHPDEGYRLSGFHGLASHGGLIGMLVSLWFYAQKTKLPLALTPVLLAVVAPLAGAFIRLANLMNSEILGKPTDLPWAFIFQKIDNIPRHPAQLYESIAYFLIFLLNYALYRRKKDKISPYFYFGFSLTLVFLSRFFIEFLKENQTAVAQDWLLNMGQKLSIPFILAGMLLMILSRFKPDPKWWAISAPKKN